MPWVLQKCHIGWLEICFGCSSLPNVINLPGVSVFCKTLSTCDMTHSKKDSAPSCVPLGRSHNFGFTNSQSNPILHFNPCFDLISITFRERGAGDSTPPVKSAAAPFLARGNPGDAGTLHAACLPARLLQHAGWA